MGKAELARPLILMGLMAAACTPLPSPSPEPTAAPASGEGASSEEAEVRDVVEGFGKRLKNVSLLSPQASAGIRAQYAGFVSDELLQRWMNDLSQAPGRVASSPWPDRIEITSNAEGRADEYLLTGYVVEVTSADVTSGGFVGKKPVRLIVQKIDGRWVIAEYAQEEHP